MYLTHRVHGQRHLPVFGGHVEDDVGVELIRRLFALASDDVGFVLAGGLSIVRIVGVVDRELIRLPQFQDMVYEVGEGCGALLLQIVHIELLQIVTK